jgi:hypothetical protein
MGRNIPNSSIIYQMVKKYSKWTENITTFFRFKAFQNVLKMGFLVFKYIYHLATLPTITFSYFLFGIIANHLETA